MHVYYTLQIKPTNCLRFSDQLWYDIVTSRGNRRTQSLFCNKLKINSTKKYFLLCSIFKQNNPFIRRIILSNNLFLPRKRTSTIYLQYMKYNSNYLFQNKWNRISLWEIFSLYKNLNSVFFLNNNNSHSFNTKTWKIRVNKLFQQRKKNEFWISLHFFTVFRSCFSSTYRKLISTTLRNVCQQSNPSSSAPPETESSASRSGFRRPSTYLHNGAGRRAS